ncbi:MAG: hypothetical protein KA297_03460 [Kofleriaceae bacterium]|nr:hypothetical protein [Kofleriaceae bacterium]
MALRPGFHRLDRGLRITTAMGPYRTPPPRTPPPPRPPPPFEEVFLAWATLALGGLRVALALVGHEPFTAEPTVALGLMLLGGIALVRTERSRRGSPKAAPDEAAKAGTDEVR